MSEATQPTTPPGPGSGFWTTAVAAERCGLTRHYLDTKARMGQLPAIGINGVWYWNPDSLLVALKALCAFDPTKWPQEPKELWSATRLGEVVGLTSTEILEQSRRGELPSFKIKNSIGFDFDAVYAILMRRSGAK